MSFPTPTSRPGSQQALHSASIDACSRLDLLGFNSDHRPSADPVEPSLESQPSTILLNELPTTLQHELDSMGRAKHACINCRRLKIRCLGAKSGCLNCSRRYLDCVYESAYRRRGSDRAVGNRPDQTKGAIVSARESIFQDVADEPLNLPDCSPVPTTIYVPPFPTNRPLVGDLLNRSASIIDPQAPTSDSNAQRCNDLLAEISSPRSPREMNGEQSQHALRDVDDHEEAGDVSTSKPRDLQDLPDSRRADIGFQKGPSIDFVKKTWWDVLLSYYRPERRTAAEAISADISFLFTTSPSRVAFMNAPLFLATLHNPKDRDKMQPCLLLACLALSNLIGASELENGEAGRMAALRLRDASQAALEASFNSQWIDPSLAYAAMLLVSFEFCAHPLHSHSRVRSSILLLDALVQSLSLTHIDVLDPQTSIFPAGHVAALPLTDNTDVANCICTSASLRSTSADSANIILLRQMMPGWPLEWTEAQIRQDECRRLVWYALEQVTCHSEEDSEWGVDHTRLFLTNPFNFSVLFLAEKQLSPEFGRSDICYNTKNSIWALYSRLILLWNSCLRMHHKTFDFSSFQLTQEELDRRVSQFTVQAWREVSAIEVALDRHTCGIEAKLLYFGRDWIFSIRTLISCRFERPVPFPEVTDTPLWFGQGEATQWTSPHFTIARRVITGFMTAASARPNLFTRKPSLAFYLMSLVSRCLTLWESFSSLTLALDLSKALLPLIEYMSAVWPCTAQREAFMVLRVRLENACACAGISPPPPPNFSFSQPPTSG